MSLAFVFPGQGSQSIGMMSALARVSPLIEATFDHLREAVAKRIENDPDTESRLVEILARTATELQKA